METLSHIDSDLFLFLNGLHVKWLDKVMVLVTDMWVWIPLYLLLIYWTVKLYGKRCWWVFFALGLVVLCTDQLASHVCKPVFQRLRPCYNTDFQYLIHLPKGLAGGRYGFVSSHAANTFGVATFLTPVLKDSTLGRPFCCFYGLLYQATAAYILVITTQATSSAVPFWAY